MSEDLFSYPFESKALSILKRALGNPEAKFREDQLEAILAVARDRKKLLLVERTGWGKSMVYFIASKIMRDQDYCLNHLNQQNVSPGPALIISPLLALMRNQIYSSKGILEMASINSSQSSEENKEAEKRFLSNDLDMLIISPERLSNQEFTEEVLAPMASKIPLMIVDEAHCISDWGHDFRPDYKRIKNIITNLPSETPLLATTATANNRVIDDIHQQLDSGISIQRGQLTRKSINLRVKKAFSYEERLSIILSDINQMKSNGMNHAGIIYALTVRDSERVAKWLQISGIKAHAYHANLENSEKLKLEEELIQNELDVLVATSALSMGFDKPDLGFVYHFQTPQSVVHYYQQVGRAGRAIPEAFGTCLLGKEDRNIVDYFIKDAFPSIYEMEKITNFLAQNGKSSEADIREKVNLKSGKVEKCLKILSTLENPPVIKDEGKWLRTSNVLDINEQKILSITALREKEWQEMIAYVDGEECLTRFLSRALGDETKVDCGRCSFCVGDESWSEHSHETLVRAREFMNRIEIPLQPRKLWLRPDFEVWPQFTGRISTAHAAEEGLALFHLSDPYGQKVLSGKTNGFDENILKNATKSIKRKWGQDLLDSDIQNKKLYIVPVPSRKSDSLKIFCQELSKNLNCYHESYLVKVKDNEQQKLMENTPHQKRNLDGVFAVTQNADLHDVQIILVDDVINSGWTFTVCSALLKEAGAKEVYPLALATINGENNIETFFN